MPSCFERKDGAGMRSPEGGNELSGGQKIRFVMHEADFVLDRHSLERR